MHHIFGLGDSHSDHKGAGSHRNSLHSCKRNKKGRVAGIITSIHVPDRRQSAQMSRDNSSTLSGDGSSTLTDGADRSVPVSREHSRQSLDTDGVPMPAQSGAHVQRQNPTADGPALTPLKENPAVQRTDSTPATSNTTARSDIIVEAKGETPKFQHQSTSPLIYQKDSNSSLKSAGISSSSVPSERKSLNLGQLGHTPQTSIDEDSIDGKNRISVSDDRASVKSADQPRRALGDHSEGSVFRKNAGEETALDRDHNTKAATTRPHDKVDADDDGNDTASINNTNEVHRSTTVDSGLSIVSAVSSKRNAEFHSLFPDASEDEYLIDDFVCASIHEVLHHGRLYLAENGLYFYANLFGRTTSFSIPFTEITGIERRNTALVIPNGIQVTTAKEKYLFASFMARELAFDKIVRLWKLSNPSLDDDNDPDVSGDTPEDASSQRQAKHRLKCRVRLRRKIMESLCTDKDHEKNNTDAIGGDEGGDDSKKSVAESRVASEQGLDASSKSSKDKDEERPRTESEDGTPDDQYTETVMDETYPTSVETMYNVLWTGSFVQNFLTDDQKLINVDISEWDQKESSSTLQRGINYIKPLNGPVGPKQTKCVIQESIQHRDFDHHVTVVATTSTPDVPSGGAFTVKTRACLTWAGGWRTRVQVTCGVEWTGRSFIKSVIDKASIDGQRDYYASMNTKIRQYLKEHAHEFGDVGNVSEQVDDTGNNEKSEGDEISDSNAATFTDGQSGLSGLYDTYLSPVVGFLSNVLGTLVEDIQKVSPVMLAFGGLLILFVLSTLFFGHPRTSYTSAQPALRGQQGEKAIEEKHLHEIVKRVTQELREPTDRDHVSSPNTHAEQHGFWHSPWKSTGLFCPPPIAHHDLNYYHTATASEIRRLMTWIDFQEQQIQSVRGDLAYLLAHHHEASEKLRNQGESAQRSTKAH